MSKNSELQFNGIYDDLIMDHYRNPRNRKLISKPDIKHHDWNPFCGDEVNIEVDMIAKHLEKLLGNKGND